jgi:hypothetical protein
MLLGKHGLIAAEQDQATSYIIPRNVPESGTLIADRKENDVYAGFSNTTKLIAANAAAKEATILCTNYRGGGYSDWYLPSSGELLELFKQKNVIGGFSQLLHNFYLQTQF